MSIEALRLEVTAALNHYRRTGTTEAYEVWRALRVELARRIGALHSGG